MAATLEFLKKKVQLGYEEGSKTFSNVKDEATEDEMYNTAVAISTLQNQPVQIIKVIQESELINA